MGAEALATLISADSHVVEPPDMWQQYCEPRVRPRVPTLRPTADRDELWCDGHQLPPIELYVHRSFRDANTAAPVRWETAIPRAAYDASARLDALDQDGVWGEVLFPTVTMSLMSGRDPELTHGMFRAYNTWLADFCRADADRLKAVALLVPDDPTAALAEAARAKALGHVGAVIPLHAPGAVPYSDPTYDSLWSGLADLDLPVHLHAATGSRASGGWNTGSGAELILRQTFAIETCLLDLVLTGLFDRCPTLRVVSVENDAGWVPHLLARADSWWRRNGSWVDDGGRKCREDPSVYFHRNVAYTFMEDRAAVLTHDLVGHDSLMWSSDFPHPSTTWPSSPARVAAGLDGLAAATRRQLCWDNAAARYGFPESPASPASPA
jgi:predicted TIM-barrel fold metal-dependent hydrolase